MVRKPPSRTSLIVVAAFLVGFVVWTALTLASPLLASMDRATLSPPLDPASATAEIAAAFALLTWPGLPYAGVLGVALWSYRHRLRQLAVALCLMVALGAAGATMLKLLFRRPRPDHVLDLITSVGYAYPSGHMTAAVACCIGVGATFAVTRQSVRAKALWQFGAIALVIAVGLDRWVLGAHYLSDIIGGALLGGLVASVSLLSAGVSVPVPHELVQEIVRARTTEPVAKRCAVIYNPAKVTDWAGFRRHVEYELNLRGWERPIWLETTVDDSGRAMTAQAVQAGVDLVLGAGGDGTIRLICDGLAGSGIPFGLIPAGTGNLLARNIGIPLDEAAALDVAFEGVDKPVDLVRLRVDGGPAEHFAVMAGIGLDAVIMEGTNPELKKAVGSAAYFLSAAQNANHPPLHTTVQVDDLPPLRRRAHVIVVGNVGLLQANIQLIPDARADDGLLDVLVASPRKLADWVRLTTNVIARRRHADEQLDRLVGRRVTITVDERDSYQLDGDTVGTCQTMIAEVVPGALLLRVPRTHEVTVVAAETRPAAAGAGATRIAVHEEGR
jgi:diacylglycerol kinase (ATP)